MRVVSIFKYGNERAICLPHDMDLDGINELEITREGDTLLLRPVKPSWKSFVHEGKEELDFLSEREDVFDKRRFELW
ncbi:MULTISPECIES: type II toxin-antitoxin system VapB family antitoxin [unclassified Enterobacter]|jgi:antitoxin VapB|uniref:type II toxin-antitoxin system VapB family antitoxin n=1 Tax=unclassified Enterobacter TaxID=2608935 RepID=UPI0015CD6C38|nr:MULTISPECIES: type II toxin-antitoxin system VapB family antitoxin [unclassified Enterobacter]MBB3307778.1 antitoxin VapB [Enterobacter sp. Sphag1F]NYI16590.1 antitoxin VapB [Enterobacter sp. Sphag71]